MPPSYIRVRAVVWAYGRGQTDRQTDTQTDTQTRVSTIHFASSTTHAKCNNEGTKNKKRRCSEETVWCEVRGVSPEAGRESMVGKFVKEVGLEPEVKERGSYGW